MRKEKANKRYPKTQHLRGTLYADVTLTSLIYSLQDLSLVIHFMLLDGLAKVIIVRTQFYPQYLLPGKLLLPQALKVPL